MRADSSTWWMLALLALLGQGRLAAAAESLADASHFSLSPAELYAAASAVNPPGEADVSVAEASDRVVFESDGSHTVTSYLVYKIKNLNPSTGAYWSLVAAAWSPWLNDKPTFRARVITPDGNAHALDPATIVDSAASALDPTLFGDARISRAPLPALGAGVVVETEISKVERLPFPGAGTITRALLQQVAPTQHVRISVQAPSSLPFRYRVDAAPGVTLRHSVENGVESWVFDAGPTAPPDDFPNLLPSDVYVYPTVSFSTGNSWSEVAAGYAKIAEEKLSQARLADLVARLTKGKTTRDATVAAIVEFLNREIRYTGVELGQASLFPSAPAETLARKYGDCKDKSLLLVAMLRAAGVDANLALLSVGSAVDVAPELPGMGLFDHAIVRVAGDPALWIDATVETARAGQLPDADRGRWSLIVDSSTSELTRVDEARSIDDGVDREREIRLSEYGPAEIIETARPRGANEIERRTVYAGTNSKALRDGLTSYVKGRYLAKDLGAIDHTDPHDLSQPFRVTIHAIAAQRGMTSLHTAGAYVNLEGLFDDLPADFRFVPRAKDEKTKREYDYQLAGPHVMESRYRIVPPAGFQLTKLPPDSALELGPARFSEHYAVDADGAVRAELRFDTVRRRFTPAERLEMRDGIAALLKRDAVLVNFDLAAHALLEQGKLQASFQAYRDMVEKHPKDPIQHLRWADALLEAGMGEAARAEALRATKLDPKSVPAQETLAFVLRHDLIGRQDMLGADYAGAAAAYRAAAALDPSLHSDIANYAVMLEYDSKGNRYSADADLTGAIREYQKLTSQELANLGMPQHLAFAMFYARRFMEALEAARALDSPPLQIIVASIAEIDGVDKALDEARRRTKDKDQFDDVVYKAGDLLMNLRDYQASASLVQAGASGNAAAQRLTLASALRKATRHEQQQFPATPEGVLRQLIATQFLAADDAKPEVLTPFLSRSARLSMEQMTPEERRRTEFIRSNMDFGRSSEVMADMMLALTQTSTSGDDAVGYRVMTQYGPVSQPVFVIKEAGQYRVLGSSAWLGPVALEILDRIERQDLDGARALVAWIRDSLPGSPFNDPYAAPPLYAFWDAGQREGDSRAIALAAAAIAVGSKETAARAVTLLEHGMSDSADDTERKRIEPALLFGYEALRRHEPALKMARAMAARSPRSVRAFQAVVTHLVALGRFSEAEEFARQRLQANADDIDALRVLARSSAAQHRYAEAYERALDVTRNGASGLNDHNNTAWISLFFDREGGPDIDAAIRAAAQPGNSGAAAMHTLACVYAELGKAREARDLLIQGMVARRQKGPDEATWYGFGRIAELYGEREIALADYAKVRPAEDPATDFESVFALTQRRLAVLGHPTTEDARRRTK
jgi:hypothetical protein